MAFSTYTAKTISPNYSTCVIAECENSAGSSVMYNATTVTYAKVDGGDQIIITVNIPLIHRNFDSGFQFG
jgi:hypothetical protein